MRKRSIFKRLGFALTGIFLFLLSVNVLKGSMRSLLPKLEGKVGFVATPHKALGFGWLAAYLILSGSPISILALSFFDVGLIGEESAFLMIVGSRLGSSFILIVIGLIEYFRRGSDLKDSISIALLSFLITYSLNFPSMFLGLFLLKHRILRLQLNLSVLTPLTNSYRPLVSLFTYTFGYIVSFLLSLCLLYVSLSVFERAFREMEVKEATSSWVNYLMEKHYFSFLFGALITLAGQSVSLSIGILIPLYLRGYIQRRNLIPYIMGTNIATFIDTLTAALILQNAAAVNLVVIKVLCLFIVSSIFLIFYRKYYTVIETTMNYFLLHRRGLLCFLLFIFVTPFLLILL